MARIKPMIQTDWGNGINQTIAAIRPGGAGNTWVLLDVEHAVDGLSGGGRAVSGRRLRQSNAGRPSYGGKIIDDSIQPHTGTLTLAISPEARKTLGFWAAPEEYLVACGSPTNYDMIVLYNCSTLGGILQYSEFAMYTDVVITSNGFSGNLANGADNGENTDNPVYITHSVDAAFKVPSAKLAHRNTSAGNTNVAINAGMYGHWQTYFAVTDTDSGDQCYIAYSTDDGASWSFVALTTLAAASDTATAIDSFNDNLLLIASPENGVAYLDYPFSGAPSGDVLATVAGATWATNFPNTVRAVGSNLVIAVGDGGNIWESLNGTNYTVPSASASATTEDLSVGVALNSRLAAFGGTNAKILRYADGVYDELTVGGGVTGTDTITAIATPTGDPYRADTVYVGTSGGDIAYTNNFSAASPTWTACTVTFTGTGSIDDIEFDMQGQIMMILHTLSSVSTVYRDLSGGAGGINVETVPNPISVQMNDLIVRSHKHMVTVGEVASSLGYTGQIIE